MTVKSRLKLTNLLITFATRPTPLRLRGSGRLELYDVATHREARAGAAGHTAQERSSQARDIVTASWAKQSRWRLPVHCWYQRCQQPDHRVPGELLSLYHCSRNGLARARCDGASADARPTTTNVPSARPTGSSTRAFACSFRPATTKHAKAASSVSSLRVRSRVHTRVAGRSFGRSTFSTRHLRI